MNVEATSNTIQVDPATATSHIQLFLAAYWRARAFKRLSSRGALKENLTEVQRAAQYRRILALWSWFGQCLQHRSTSAREPFLHPQFQDIRRHQRSRDLHQSDKPPHSGKSSSPNPTGLGCRHHFFRSCKAPSVQNTYISEFWLRAGLLLDKPDCFFCCLLVTQKMT